MSQKQKPLDTIQIASKSIWNERHSHNLNFYCPVCTVPRRIGKKPKAGHPMHFLQVGLTAAVITFITWPLFGIKGVVSFLPLWVLFEVFYRARVRASLVCERCGFDPYLYLIDAPKAKEAILAKRAEAEAAREEARQAALEEAAGTDAAQDSAEEEEESSAKTEL